MNNETKNVIDSVIPLNSIQGSSIVRFFDRLPTVPILPNGETYSNVKTGHWTPLITEWSQGGLVNLPNVRYLQNDGVFVRVGNLLYLSWDLIIEQYSGRNATTLLSLQNLPNAPTQSFDSCVFVGTTDPLMRTQFVTRPRRVTVDVQSDILAFMFMQEINNQTVLLDMHSLGPNATRFRGDILCAIE